jgi:hypothetical protein
MIVGENTCDGKKKAYETLGTLVDNLYVMDLPQTKTDQTKDLLKAEYLKFKAAVENLTGVAVTSESLKSAIDVVNAKRAAIHRLSALRKADPAPFPAWMPCWPTRCSFTTTRPGSRNRSTKSVMNWKPGSRKKPGHFLPAPPGYWCPAAPRRFPTGNCT